ncbi:MAG: aminotransferase class I/II-fold pyridoxal phosphate-dependent enzyme [Candidatus Zixiibacteriota bacterium]
MLAEYFAQLEDNPLFPNVDPQALRESFAEPIPQDGIAADTIIDELERKLLPYCTQVNHPGYFGYITPTATPAGVIGDLIASALNQNLALWSIGPSAVAMERQTIRWLDDLIGYDERAGGNLTSGGMMANFIALKLARDAVSNDTAQHDGIRQPSAVYTSEERHVSVDKALDAVGIGRNMLRVLPTDAHFRLDIDALEESLAIDTDNGIRPVCIVAAGGSTNNGAVDDLKRLRAIADRVGAWLHVDSAYGGGMLLSQKFPGVLDGLHLADSVTLDPHKWFYAPLDAGAILVKDESRLTKSFGMRPPYLDGEDIHLGDRYDYYVHGFEQSRRFRSLKVWMGFKRYGARQIGQWVDANVEHARHLYQLATDHPDFQPATFPIMSAICIRYCPEEFSPDVAAKLHATVAKRIAAQGRFWFSTTVMKGQTWFRINPVNFRTRMEHMDQLFDALCAECEAVRAGR